MSDLKPQPSIEILASRLFNELESNPNIDIETLDEAKLFELFADREDLPNKTTELALRDSEKKIKDIKAQLKEILEQEEIDFTRPVVTKAYLDRFMEDQDEAKKKISIVLADYLTYGTRNGLILLGPSGCGKTYSWELISKKLSIPLVKKSLANATGAGFKGQNLTEGLEAFIGKEKGILFLDELDKTAPGALDFGSGGGFGEQLQNELLAFLTGEVIKVEGANPQKDSGDQKKERRATIYGPSKVGSTSSSKYVDFANSLRKYLSARNIQSEFVGSETTFEDIPDKVKKIITGSKKEIADNFVLELDKKYIESPSQEKLDKLLSQGSVSLKKGKEIPPGFVDMSKILVVAAGAFHGNKKSSSLYKIVQRRLGGNTCKLNETQLLENVTDADLMEYGIKPELVGRLPLRAVLKPLNTDGLFRILKKSEDSPLDKVRKQFYQNGIEINFDDPALLLLAQYAQEGIGVRGLQKVLLDLTAEISFNREQFVGRTLNFTRSDLEKKLAKKVQFEKVDKYEVDWNNIASIKGYLDLFVPKQEKAKTELAKAFHLYHTKMSQPGLELPMTNILLTGPTGSGKTYMIKLLAEKAELPIAQTNITGKVPNGFAGEQLDNIFDQFSQNQKYGIVYLDEVDKVLLNPGDPLNNELIGMIENGEVRGRKTKDYLFVLSGAFQDIYNKDGKINRDNLLKNGVREEILGRLPIQVDLDAPTIDTMVSVLKGPRSVVDQYKNYLRTRNLEVEIEEKAYRIIAQNALKTKLGYRALKTICSDVFGEYMTNTPKYVKNGKLKIKAETVDEILEAKK
jgi:ATP-dependent Clp protease ATP-binding subunit ClpX